MNRSSCTPAIILNLKPLGENNSSVTLLTPSDGIIYATLYGGPKSKMKSLVAQWNSGNIWLYENPEKKQKKITDFEVLNYHSSFTENLFKTFAASLAAELAIKTQCGGSNTQCFKLVSALFDGMNLCDENQSRLGLIRFLWRYLELLGIQPDAGECGICGESFFSAKFDNDVISYYNIQDNCFCCGECKGNIPVKNNSLKYLFAVTNKSPAEVRQLSVTMEEYQQLKELVFFLIENTIEQKLNSIETGLGIL